MSVNRMKNSTISAKRAHHLTISNKYLPSVSYRFLEKKGIETTEKYKKTRKK